MSLITVNPQQERNIVALYGDQIFDLEGVKEIECKDETDALTALAELYRPESNVMTVYSSKYTNPTCIWVNRQNFAVFDIVTGADVVKDFQLSENSPALGEMLIVSGNIIVQKSSEPIALTSWYPLFLSRKMETKVYVHLLSDGHALDKLTLNVKSGLLSAGIKDKYIPRVEFYAIPEFNKQQSMIANLLTPLANMWMNKLGVPFTISQNTDENVDQSSSNSIGVHVKPYACVMFEGSNIISSTAQRPGYALAEEYTLHARSNGVVSVNIPQANSGPERAQVNIAKYGGQAHTNISISSDQARTVDLLINEQVYFSMNVEAGVTFIHDTPILQMPYDTYTVRISGESPATITWESLSLGKDPTKFSGIIVTPEFNLVSEGGRTYQKRDKKAAAKQFAELVSMIPFRNL